MEYAGAYQAPRNLAGPRQGLDHARNRAVVEARGRVLLFGDDDILVAPDWIRQLAGPLLADTEGRIGAVGGEVIPVFPEGQPDWIRDCHAPLAFRPDAGPLPAGQCRTLPLATLEACAAHSLVL